MKREVLLRPEAEADIKDIATYSIKTWGRDHARRYVTGLRMAIGGLASTADRHPAAHRNFPGMRRLKYQYHIIFFLTEEGSIDVVRVLHERRDAGRELN